MKLKSPPTPPPPWFQPSQGAPHASWEDSLETPDLGEGTKVQEPGQGDA